MKLHRPLAGRARGLAAPLATLLPTVAHMARGLFTIVVVMSGLAGAVGPANAATPVVPLVTAHHHWEHQWFVWLPRHPVYESVEVMSIDSAGDYFRAVWVFFTERHGGKRQVHFFDDRRMVEHFPGSHYRPIEIAVDLDAGGALTGYRHDAAANRLAFKLEAALPLAADAPPAAREFAIHMNPGEPVARGEVVSEPVEGGRRLTWRLHSPPWAVNYPFESIIQSNGDGHALQIRSLSR